MKKFCDMSQLHLSEDVATNNGNNNKVINMVIVKKNIQAQIDPKEENFIFFHEFTNSMMQKLRPSLLK